LKNAGLTHRSTELNEVNHVGHYKRFFVRTYNIQLSHERMLITTKIHLLTV